MLSIFPLIAIAEDDQEATLSKSHCYDPENKQQFEKMLPQFPGDTDIIKLYTLREGLCAMIDKGQISLDAGIDIWDEERSKIVIDRSKDELGKVAVIVKTRRQRNKMRLLRKRLTSEFIT